MTLERVTHPFHPVSPRGQKDRFKMSAYDQILGKLGVSEDDLVTDVELEEITRLLKELQIDAAKVARDHDTSDTLAKLQAGKAAFRQILRMTVQQARAYNHAVSIGQEASIPGVTSVDNGYQPAALSGGTSDTGSSTTDTPEVEQLIALARQYPDRASFLSAVLQELSQLDPAVADITVRLTSKVAQREPGWEAIAHPRTGEPTTQALLDAEQRIAELERQLAAANRAIADIATKGATPLHDAKEMARRLSHGPVDNVNPADAVTLYRSLENLQSAVENAAGPGTTTGRTSTGRRARP
jgi:hypothetical protein